MMLKCPGCASPLSLGEDLFAEKVVVRCPECLQVFIARSDQLQPEGEALSEATLLISDKPVAKKGDVVWQSHAASLTVIRGPDQGIHLKLKKDEIICGREEADLILSDPAVSRWHFKIIKQKGRIWLEDLGSRNGIFLNKKRIQRAELNHLDEIELGQTLIVYSEYGQKQETKIEDLSLELDKLRDETKAGEKAPAEQLPRGREFLLEVMKHPGRARSYQIKNSPFILGRGEEAELKLDDDEASRKHAMIEIYSKDNVYLTDLASANGTFLNGVRVRSTRLKHNDKIRLGQTILSFVLKDLPDAD